MPRLRRFKTSHRKRRIAKALVARYLPCGNPPCRSRRSSRRQTGRAQRKRKLPKFETPTFKLPSIDFENLFGRLLPIWAGGVALAVAGFFLVRYSIAAGFFGPTIRVALGFVFGAGLVAAAELAHRNAVRIADPRVGQVLAGAGLATLYGAFYMAGTQYDLVGTGIAFAGMAAVTAAAIGLSFRFGLPSAILGLVGGFAAPLLVSSDAPNLGLLSLYLALVTAGLSKAGANQGRSWLALASLAGGLGWGALILISGVTGSTDIVAFGGYLVLLGAVIPAFTQGPNVSPVLRAIIGAVAAAQMAAMVALSGFTPMAWALYLLLGTALTGLAWRDARLQEGAAFAGLTGLFLLGLWTGSTTGGFLTILAAMVALFITIPAIRLVRGKDAAILHVQVAALALGFASGRCFAVHGGMVRNCAGDYPACRCGASTCSSLVSLPCRRRTVRLEAAAERGRGGNPACGGCGAGPAGMDGTARDRAGGDGAGGACMAAGRARPAWPVRRHHRSHVARPGLRVELYRGGAPDRT